MRGAMIATSPPLNPLKISILKNAMHRQVLILATVQALLQIASIMVIAIGGLTGSQLASAPQWATLPCP